MLDNIRLCMGCMKPISENAVICPHCAYNSLSPQHSPYLPKGTLLLGRYTVGKVVSVSSDKATYIGFDHTENKIVTVHEFLPQKLVIREVDEEAVTVKVKYEHLYYECMGSFETLWKNLQEAKGFSALDEVFEVFYLNNTVYAVCQHSECITLKEYFETREKLLSWNKAVAAFKPVINALSRLHKQGIIHGELSPSSVLVGADGKLRLSSFSIAQSHGQIPEISAPAASGYAPIERLKDNALLSPASDVYSLTALIYTAVTGLVPPPANARMSEDTLLIPAPIMQTMPQQSVDAFYHAMQIFPSARMKNMQELLLAFSAPPSTQTPVQQPQNIPPQPNRQQSSAPEEKKPQEKKPEEKGSSAASVVLKAFVTAFCVIVLVFATMYTTFLYKHINIPVLNSVFSVFTFLPMNMDEEEAETTTQPPVTTTGVEISAQQTVVVADFTKLLYTDVKQNAVFNANFDLVYDFEYSDTYEENTIISQSIPHGQSVVKGTTITLVISKGVESVVLKDVIGMDYEDAKAVLEDDGFVVKRKLLKNDGVQPVGQVFTMSLVAGLEFDKGTEITLSVWDEVKAEKTTAKDKTNE